jgi:hypothetical protein
VRVFETASPDAGAVLPGANFADTWGITPVPADLDLYATSVCLGRVLPVWVRLLLRLRDFLVRPFGLTGARDVQTEDGPFFPLISQGKDGVVLGLDDRHLDFRLFMTRGVTGDGLPSLMVTTFVRTHNMGGRLYLAAVKPFHRLIVPTMMRRALDDNQRLSDGVRTLD